MTYMKSTNDKNCTFSETLYTQGMGFYRNISKSDAESQNL